MLKLEQHLLSTQQAKWGRLGTAHLATPLMQVLWLYGDAGAGRVADNYLHHCMQMLMRMAITLRLLRGRQAMLQPAGRGSHRQLLAPLCSTIVAGDISKGSKPVSFGPLPCHVGNFRS